jgi:uncharacterized protein with GYD domain
MATYVSLLKLTAQGLSNIKDTVKRAEKASQLAEKLGGRMTNIVWTQGAYDLVVTTEFADDQKQAAFIIATTMQGNITTETMRAFTAEEVTQIIEMLP